jgi:site-specific recombinase XerD
VRDHLEWLRLRGLRQSTITTRRNRLRHLQRALGTDDLLAVTPEQLHDWQAALRLTPAAHAAYVSNVQQFYAWALDEGLIGTDPARKLIKPKVPRRLPRPIAEDDLAFAVAAASVRVRPWLVLAGWAGLRAQEIAYLERAEVRETDRPPHLIVIDGKGGRQRVVPLHPRVEAALRPMPAAGFLFLRRDGQPGPNAPWMVSHLANEHLHELGIDATLHQIRHRFGTRLHAACHDLRVVQEVMGHSSPSTTAGYVEYSRQLAVDAVNRIDGTDDGPAVVESYRPLRRLRTGGGSRPGVGRTAR